MWLERFLSLIDRTAVGAFVAKRHELLERTDPDRIYVENIRSFFGFPFPVAKALCELAVREGLFVRRVGLLCPNDPCRRLILALSPDEAVPATVNCQVCEVDERDPHEFPADALTHIVFYRLKD